MSDKLVDHIIENFFPDARVVAHRQRLSPKPKPLKGTVTLSPGVEYIPAPRKVK